MKRAAECGGLEDFALDIERRFDSKQARRGRRAALPVTLDEDHLFDLLNDDWPQEKPRKRYLGGGLLCLMHPGGEVSIKLKYRHQGKELQLHLGELGNNPPDEILEKYRQAKAMLQAGSNPMAVIGAEELGLTAQLQDAMERLETHIREHFPKRRRQ